jgi:starch phosphorylase
MKSIRFPTLPSRIAGLERIACNLNWSWNNRAIELFKRIDPELWLTSEQNPVRMLNEIDPEQLGRAALDPDFIRQYKLVTKLLFGNGRPPRQWFEREYPQWSGRKIAYFSAEFGIHSSLPIYSGGLGILAGDHCKQSSDLGVPLIAVGFVYPQGYFHQRILPDGRQEDIYEILDRRMAPIEPASPVDTEVNDGNARFLVELSVGPSKLFVEVWRVHLGSICMYLMDTDVQENSPEDRELTARLYGGDKDHRVRQEIVLGIGGVRVLRALGLQPDIFHGNEGHTSFMLLERTRELVKSGLKFDDAAARIRAASIFTTHTPVPAGHDSFPFSMIETRFAGFWDEMGISKQQFLDLGAYNGEFNMTVLSMTLAGRRNGVSKLHGRVTRRMWRALWPGVAEEEIPVSSITNGVHAPSWIAPEMARLFDRHFGSEWIEQYDDVDYWNKVTEIPDEDFWNVHQTLKKKLLSFARERARVRWAESAIDSGQAIAMGTLLDPDTLTIGFARRFTAYKRATLLFHDLDRIKKILLNKTMPVQIVFAGKAHPADENGKELIHQIYTLASDRSTAGRVAFIENYELHSARFLTQGVDVWLNNPRAPLEACGTSGQKAGMNGAINLSILDGWWYEACNGDNGWAIGDAPEDLEVHSDDAADANALYELLEQEVVPLYYDRDQNGLPHGWIQMAKESLRSIVPQYSACRMLKEYSQKLYVPALLESEKAKSGI